MLNNIKMMQHDRVQSGRVVAKRIRWIFEFSLEHRRTYSVPNGFAIDYFGSALTAMFWFSKYKKLFEQFFLHPPRKKFIKTPFPHYVISTFDCSSELDPV